ncbi:sensor histidine kinase, partial [Marinirhabdus gelatinilytica]|uniref:sensor histidine kinase n=1 Tax=Marinirhabdus gelatinilytica TaxID=1703343 RepID=UPI001472AF79
QNKLQEQRLRISRDLHDNIGSQLTFVTSSIDNLQYALEIGNEKVTQKLGDISEFTTQTIYELRDTIWAMNKTQVTAEDLQVRIANFIDKAGKAAEGVTFNFEVDEGVSEKTFTSVEGMNVYRIIQESVNNALKHAQASKISVVMKQSEKGTLVEITDNGVGFNEAEIEAGNGLANIRKRARDIGGKAQIVSENGNGAKITIHF